MEEGREGETQPPEGQQSQVQLLLETILNFKWDPV